MEKYDITQLVKLARVPRKNRHSNEPEKYRYWVQYYAEINKPDFLLVLSLSNPNPIIYIKNYNFPFSGDPSQLVPKIIEGVEPTMADKIFKLDSKFITMALRQKVIHKVALMQLVFLCSVNNSSLVMQRDVSIVPKEYSDGDNLILAAFTDVSSLFQGAKNLPSVYLRYNTDLETHVKEKLKSLQSQLKKVLHPEMGLGKREKEVLELIAQGKTSRQIADLLSISVNTVNTHRQNLIKKFGVKSTAALIREIRF